ncbi:Stage III sporulation protein AE precursor [uncultured Roseburia sp.]|uniref:Stage III sporulation protein AE n=1 Tax=Brotonthovivens ammoniilytica TaxID=2981725 RepID=A0ABT2TFL2_9FIRM|nr:stage III sporulation protein AE [Brotonthovivens ammoniilytica]MCU6760972.1 stage III sporulation protein AE [Brotonthovivens ammoniilytica]SCI15026.1 Stage III sporulation protein AE precursor [uncultured Roseburia sp.]
MKKKIVNGIFLVFLLTAVFQFSVRAADLSNGDTAGPVISEETDGSNQVDESMLNGIDFTDIDNFLNETKETDGITFRQLVETIISQDGQVDKKWVFTQIWNLIAKELVESKSIFAQLLIMCVAFAVLHNFANVFENSQIHTTCFYMFYMALITLLMRSYLLTHQILTEVLGSLVDFMQAVIPAFCMALMFSSAASTAAVFYQIIVAVIYLIERILLYVIVPGIHIYVVLQMLNHMTGEAMISRITGLLKKFITWGLKIMVAAITGMNIIQSLIAPALDGLKNTAITKTLNMIPGLGGSANAVTSMFLGSAVVIKNGIGVAALIILLVLCLGPLFKMGVLTFLYKVTGAVVQPISDSRVCGCISSVGEGASLLLKVLLAAMMMFMVTIAIITAAVR